MMRWAIVPTRVEPPERTMPRGADITKAISAPSAATEIVEIDADSKSPQLIATWLPKNLEINT